MCKSIRSSILRLPRQRNTETTTRRRAGMDGQMVLITTAGLSPDVLACSGRCKFLSNCFHDRDRYRCYSRSTVGRLLRNLPSVRGGPVRPRRTSECLREHIPELPAEHAARCIIRSRDGIVRLPEASRYGM